MTKLPIILKGIVTGEDARLAVKYAVDGIFVSIHGGRQLDTVSVPVSLDDLEKFVTSGWQKCKSAYKELLYTLRVLHENFSIL